MPTFIDESGDTGWKPGSRPYFRMGAVWLPTPDVVAACRKSIQAVRANLGLKSDYEFKFAQTSSHPQRCTAYFQAVLEHEFRFVVCAYDKHRIDPPGSVEAPDFHRGCAVTLASHLRANYLAAEELKGLKRGGKPRLLEELVVVDDNQDKDFLAAIKSAFRAPESGRQPGARLIGKVKFRASRPDEMIQLVDMVLGAAGAHLGGKSRWYRQIENRSLGLICLP
jgi:hypothetical protein